jgi:hypothetical protein
MSVPGRRPGKAPHRWKGRCALAAALVGVGLFVGSFFAYETWLVDTTAKVIVFCSVAFWLAALVIGALGWRSASAKVAVGIVLGVVALILLVASTATWQ